MSNALPHTHEIQLCQYYDQSGTWRVRYGDSKVVLWFSLNGWPKPFWERRIRRATKKVIRKHDRGSVRHGKRQAEREKTRAYAAQLTRDLNEKVAASTGDWASSKT